MNHISYNSIRDDGILCERFGLIYELRHTQCSWTYEIQNYKFINQNTMKISMQKKQTNEKSSL